MAYTFERKDLDRLGIVFESEEEAGWLVDTLQEDMADRITDAVAEGKTPEQLRLFNQTGNTDQVEAWLKKYVPDYKEIAENAEADVKRELLVFHDRLPGTTVTRCFEEDQTDINALNLTLRNRVSLRGADINTVGALAASIGRLPTGLDRSGRTRVVKALWDYLMKEPAVRYQVGTAIHHPMFGTGTICGFDSYNGRLKIDFGEHGVKTLGTDWVEKNCMEA